MGILLAAVVCAKSAGGMFPPGADAAERCTVTISAQALAQPLMVELLELKVSDSGRDARRPAAPPRCRSVQDRVSISLVDDCENNSEACAEDGTGTLRLVASGRVNLAEETKLAVCKFALEPAVGLQVEAVLGSTATMEAVDPTAIRTSITTRDCKSMEGGTL